jgi:hypothetical protein
MAEPIAQLPWMPLRGVVSSADTDLAAATKTWATFVSTYHPTGGSSAIAVRIPRTCRDIAICFDHKNADDDTAAVSLYGYREGGPAEFICSIDTITAGDQESDLGSPSTNRYFCDTIGTVTERHVIYPNPTGATATVEVDGGGNNGVAKLYFASRGFKYLLCLFTTISTNDNVRAWFTGVS